MPGPARGPVPVWVTQRGVTPDIPGVERMRSTSGYYLVHAWFGDAYLFEQIEAMFRSVDGETASHPVTAGDRTDPIIRAFEDERLWLWRMPIPGVPWPTPFPERPKSAPPPEKPTEVLTWIEVSLEDEAGDAVVDERVEIVDPDGARHHPRTNEHGLVRLENIHTGICEVRFPGIDGREWARRGTAYSIGGGFTSRTVGRGQHGSLIATRAGFRALATVWSHPGNNRLAATRDPNLLVPSDAIALPSRDDRMEDCGTATRHPFVVRTGALRLRVKFQQPLGEPWVAGACDVTVRRELVSQRRDARGAIEVDVPMDVQQVEVGGVTPQSLHLWAGDLEPSDTERGVRQRLLCLGYLDAEDATPSELCAALEEFQCDESLGITGEADAATRAKLREVHGC